MKFLNHQKKIKLFKLASFAALAAFVAVLNPASAMADQLATGVNYEKDSTNIRTLTFDDIRGARFCELFFIKVKGDMKELQVYNPTGHE